MRVQVQGGRVIAYASADYLGLSCGGGIHAGKHGNVRDINTSKPDHVTIHGCLAKRGAIQELGKERRC